MSRCALSKAARELLLAVWPCALALLSGAAGGDAASTPLVVVIAVDQLRNDRLTADLPGGLGRIVRQGYRFENSSLAHGLSNTCPGHAALSTGMHPGKAGVPGNEYVDRAGWRERYCVEDNDAAHRVIGGSRNRSPELLKVTALGDWLRSSFPGARVFSVGGKDRSAIMMGGRHPNGVFWFDPDQMRFTSSGYYAGTLPAYVDAFNSGWEARLPARWEHPPGTHRPDDFQG